MKRNSVNLWLLLAITAGPVIGGWLLYFNPHWLPDTRANRGELIDPVVPLNDITLADPNGAAVAFENPRGQWTMLIAAEQWAQSCRQELWKGRQVRLALGEGRTRVERLLVLGSPPSTSVEAWLRSEHPGLRVIVPTGDPLKTLRQHLAAAGEPLACSLSVVDPMGNLMMRYPAETPARDMLTDFERLLKISENWSANASH